MTGAEGLKTNLSNPRLSFLKYILNNTELADNEVNRCFKQFFEFINHMLFFRSLHQNEYLGLEIGSRNIYSDILEQGHLQDFQDFLHEAGIDYKLCVVKESVEETIAVDFGGKKIAFHLLASSGTKLLSLFYYWLQRLQAAQVSFLFLDEFDAFYHHELSAFIMNKLKEIGIQSVITTHNTSIMSNDLLRPDCYFFLKDGQIRSLAERTNKELREAHNIEKMYKAGTFDE
ncbi:MAG: AAA family ATPase [Mangrovibacterium sp.]